jgi:polyisoprenoid-binding protein YceI
MRRAWAGVVALLLLLGGHAGAAHKTLEGVKGESTMAYKLIHPMHEIVAVSKDVGYRIDVDDDTGAISGVTAHVDVTTYDSGNSSRDSHAMEVIDALMFPEASFASTGIVQQGDSLLVSGKVTFHGVTRDTMIRAKAVRSDHRLRVEGVFNLSMTDFGIERPSLLLIPSEDLLRFSFTAVFPWD